MSTLTPRLDRLERNYIINGNFDFWQRGTSGTITNNDNNIYVADRWYLRFEGNQTAGTITYNRQTNAGPNAKAVYTARVAQTAGSAAALLQYHLRQVIEKHISSKFVYSTFSIGFWYKSNKTGNHGIAIAPGGNAYTGTSTYSTTFSVLQANTWEYKSFVIPALAVGNGTAAENAAGLLVNIGFYANGGQLTINTNDYFELSQVVITNGEVGEPQYFYAGGDLAGELALCQRYFEKNYALEHLPGSNRTGDALNADGVRWQSALTSVSHGYRLRVEKRTTPGIVLYDWVGNINRARVNGADNSTSYTVDWGGHTTFHVNCTVSATEIFFYWTADAEL